MKKVLLLQSRPEQQVSDNEFESFCRLGGLNPDAVERMQIHERELPEVNLDDYSAVLMGGGPTNFAYDESKKSEQQKRMEAWLCRLFETIVAHDKPFLGACLGFGLAVVAFNGDIDFEHGEAVGAADVALTDAGRDDPLLNGLPDDFVAYVGHKEGAGDVPDGIIELARSNACSQMLRIGRHVYATQFHPELDLPSLILRIRAYQNNGYFAPEEMDDLIAHVSSYVVEYPSHILRNFVKTYVGNV